MTVLIYFLTHFISNHFFYSYFLARSWARFTIWLMFVIWLLELILFFFCPLNHATGSRGFRGASGDSTTCCCWFERARFGRVRCFTIVKKWVVVCCHLLHGSVKACNVLDYMLIITFLPLNFHRIKSLWTIDICNFVVYFFYVVYSIPPKLVNYFSTSAATVLS